MESWAVENWTMLSSRFGFTALDICRTGWMIENHLPWAIKKVDKRRMLALTAMNALDGTDAFVTLLKADTWGRISDDAEEKRTKTNEWCDEFIHFCSEVEVVKKPDNAPKMFMLIGASGSGKSTFYDTVATDKECFSLDRLRLEWYNMDDYADAFAKACADRSFLNDANREYTAMLNTGKDVVIDNVNTSKKRRGNYIRQAKNAGYHTVGVIFPISLKELVARQHTREDKNVPEEAVRRQYNTLSLPSYGEFDEVYVVDSNLQK